MERCLYCYKELADGERDFHKSCSKKIFGTPQVPLLPYTRAYIFRSIPVHFPAAYKA